MLAACGGRGGGAADLILTGAAIWTGDAETPEAQAIAVVGDRIVEVGSAAAIDRWRGPHTQIIDAGGRRVVPGFNDAHVHFAAGGNQLVSVDLRDAGSPDEFARRILERARTRPGEWILGGRWDERRWAPNAPTRQLIDDGTNGTPVFVVRIDGRAALANSAALGRAGITERTSDPPGGRIVRDAAGFPTGLLEGAAVEVVARVLPTPTADERRQTIGRALDHAASLGVTSVQDMGPDSADVSMYAEMAERGTLTARIYVLPAETRWFEQARLGVRRAFGSSLLRLGGAAGDAAPDAGEQLLTRLMAADHAGLQLCLNAQLDGGSSALDLLSSVVRANGDRDRRMRIEHAERFTTADVERLTRLAAVASIQPVGTPDGASIRRLAQAHARLAMATDWPSASLNPMIGIAAAARVMPVADAIAAYTKGSAFAEFQDRDKGTIVRGALADLAVLTDDVLHVPPERIASVATVMTIVGGKVVHQRRP